MRGNATEVSFHGCFICFVSISHIHVVKEYLASLRLQELKAEAAAAAAVPPSAAAAAYTNTFTFTEEEDAILMGNQNLVQFAQHEEEEAGETSQLTEGSTERYR
jgi:hypothetical protein